jgi:hypothetical protein
MSRLDQLAQDEIDAPVNGDKGAAKVSFRIVAQEKAGDDMGGEKRERRGDGEPADVLRKRPQIIAEKIRHEADHADGGPALAEPADIDGNENDDQEREIGGDRYGRENAGRESGCDGACECVDARFHLGAGALVADGGRGGEGNHDREAIGGRRQGMQKRQTGNQCAAHQQ